MRDDAGSSFAALRKRLAFSIHSKISGAFKNQDPYMYFEVFIWTSLPIGQKEMRRSLPAPRASTLQKNYTRTRTLKRLKQQTNEWTHSLKQQTNEWTHSHAHMFTHTHIHMDSGGDVNE